MSEQNQMISVNGLIKTYGDFTAVDGITFEVFKGEVFGVLGPNGAGKTTTLEMLVGLRKPDGGSANIGGFDVVRDLKKSKRLLASSFSLRLFLSF